MNSYVLDSGSRNPEKKGLPGTVPFHWRKRMIFSTHRPNWVAKLMWVIRVGAPSKQGNARDSQEDHRGTSGPATVPYPGRHRNKHKIGASTG